MSPTSPTKPTGERVSFTIALGKAIGDELGSAVEDQGPYAAPEVERVRVSDDRTQVTVECSAGCDVAALRPQVERYVEDFVKRFRAVAGKVYRTTERRNDTLPMSTGVFVELCARGWAFQLGDGQVGLAGPAMKLVDALDQRFRHMAMSQFGAVEHRYPTFIPTDVLRRCGYFGAFPHLVSLVGHFVEDYRALKEIRDANAESDRVVIPNRDSIVQAAACITPATCYHVYQSLEGKTVQAPGQIFTATGRCARYESTNMTGLDRLWEFTMREMVLVGAEGWVTEMRQKGMDAFIALIEEWDLEASIETANDPFFAPVYATKTFWQSQGGLKYELRVTVEPGEGGRPRTISCGSANLHEGFFGQTFALSLPGGEAVFTGCVALGVERLALAVFTQHGFDPARWPAPLRDAVYG
jgi:seryl-tRNA synthetase